MSEAGDEERLEDFVQGRSVLNRAYRDAARPEPSPALDAVILAAARNAVAPRRRPWAMRWGAPLAAAAVLALAVAVGVQLRDQTDLSQGVAPPAAGARSTAPFERKQTEVRPDRQGRQRLETARKSEQAATEGLAEAPPAPQQENAQRVSPGAQADRHASPAAAEALQDEQPRAESRKEAGSALRDGTPAAALADAGLARIREQYAAGQTEQADRNLREYCRAFPDHPVPPDLAAHAGRLAPACERRRDDR